MNSSALDQPQRTSGVSQELGHQLRDDLTILMSQITVEQQNLERGVILQETSNQVNLVPGPPLQNPFRRIFEGPHDIVDVYQHARLQTRQDLKKQIIDVAPQLGHVQRIDEKDIVRLQVHQPIDWNSLQWRFDQLHS